MTLALADQRPPPPYTVVRRSEVQAGRDRRFFAAGTVVATAVALVLGWSGWQRAPIGYDEAVTASLATGRFASSTSILWHRELNGALYDLVMRPWTALAGTGPVALRLPSLAFMVVTVPLVAVLARRVVGPRPAVVAGLALAVNGSFVAVGQTASGRALCTLCGVGCALAADRARRSRTNRWWAVVAVAGAAAIWSDVFGFAIVIAVLLSVLALPRTTVAIRPVVTTGLIVALLVSPMLWFLGSGRSTYAGWRGTARGQHHLLQRSLRYLVGGHPTWLVSFLVIGLLACGLAWWRWRVLGRDDPSEGWALPLVAAWLVVPVAGAIALSALVPILAPSYLVVVLPGVALLTALAVTILPGGRMRGAVAVAVLAIQLVAAVPSSAARTEQWRPLADALVAQSGPGQTVLVQPGYERTTLAYYLRARPGLRLLSTGTASDWTVVVDDVPHPSPVCARAHQFGQLTLCRSG